jgi:hypothetical protein
MTLTIVIVIWVGLVTTGPSPDSSTATPALSEATRGLQANLWIILVAALIVTLITFAAWLSRVVANIPALTGTFPKATPRMTIVQVLIPILNLRWILSILREALRHLDPRGNGDALVAAAILPPLVAAIGWLALRYLLLGTRIAGVLSRRQAIDLVEVLGQVTVGLFAVSAVMIVVIIVRIERRSAGLARDAG